MFRVFKCEGVKQHVPRPGMAGNIQFEAWFTDAEKKPGVAANVIHLWGLDSCPWIAQKHYVVGLSETPASDAALNAPDAAGHAPAPAVVPEAVAPGDVHDEVLTAVSKAGGSDVAALDAAKAASETHADPATAGDAAAITAAAVAAVKRHGGKPEHMAAAAAAVKSLSELPAAAGPALEGGDALEAHQAAPAGPAEPPVRILNGVVVGVKVAARKALSFVQRQGGKVIQK